MRKVIGEVPSAILVVAANVFLLLVSTGLPQTAEHTAVYLIGANCGGAPPAKSWMAGHVFHVRGVTFLHGITSDNPLLTGTDMMVADYDFNTKTGKGTLHGRITLYPIEVEGTWEGIMSGQFYGGRTYLQVVAHGTGSLSGQTLKYDMEASIPAEEVPGLPADICSGYPLDPPDVGFVAEGRILTPHGY